MRLKSLKKPKKIQRFVKIVFPVVTFFTLISKVFKSTNRSKVLGIKPKKSKKIIGIMAVTTFLFFEFRFLYLNVFAVDKSAQGKGYGKTALKTLEHKAKKNGHDVLFLASMPDRKKARKFYQKQGFRRFLGVFFWKKL